MKFLEFDVITGATGRIVMVDGKPCVCVSKPNTQPVLLSPMPYIVKLLGLERELAAAVAHTPKPPRYR